MARFLTAAPQRHQWLTIYPLIGSNGQGAQYELLPDAIRAGTLKVTEIGSGTVPALLAINEGDGDVLVLDGEQFIGARQNRMASRSIVLPARSTTKIPVNCMEQGRWRPMGRHFAPSPYYSSPKVRGHNRKTERARVEAGAAAGSDELSVAQGAVWDEIAMLSNNYGHYSDTGALDEVVNRKAQDLDAWRAGFTAVPGQIGLLAFVGDEALGLDVLASPELYRRVHERLVTACVQDALRERVDPGKTPDPEAAADFIRRTENAPRKEAPTVGRGVYRVLTGEVAGGELEDSGRLVHLSVVPPQ